MKRQRFPFESSLRSLLAIATEEMGAVGYALYEFDETLGRYEVRLRAGVPARQPGHVPVKVSGTPLRLLSDAAGTPALVSLPLRAARAGTVVLDFGFAEARPLGTEQLAVIEKTARAAERLLAAGQPNPELGRLVERIAQLERVLAEQVIAERAQGLHEAREARAERTMALHDHIERVLDGPATEQALADKLRELESRLSQRELLARAKAVLRRQQGLTEEQAYLRLRGESRRTRTPLSAVAQSVILNEAGDLN